MRTLHLVTDTYNTGSLTVTAILYLSLFITYPAIGAVSSERDTCRKGTILGAPDAWKMVESFLSAADRGEVLVLGHRVKRKEIVPIRISYHLELNTSARSVEIYSELKNPVALPDSRDKVTAISGILSIFGELGEVQLHVWPK